jgi:4a-hydroxytetrahydrobiopterin dehydratase
MSDLSNQQCKACEGGVSPLELEESEKYLNKLASDWTISDAGTTIFRTFQFKNYYETMAFSNVVAMVAHQQDHHPEMTIGYKTCHVEYSTHSLGGLSENDFICAAKIDDALSL